MDWWNDMPLAVERPRPQATVTLEDYLAARSRVTQPRNVVIVELLWYTGMRWSEITRAQVNHAGLSAGILTTLLQRPESSEQCLFASCCAGPEGFLERTHRGVYNPIDI